MVQKVPNQSLKLTCEDASSLALSLDGAGARRGMNPAMRPHLDLGFGRGSDGSRHLGGRAVAGALRDHCSGRIGREAVNG